MVYNLRIPDYYFKLSLKTKVMKKQEMHPVKEQYRGSDKNQSQDRSTKTKPQMEERSSKKTSSEQEDVDMGYADLDDRSAEKETDRKQTKDPKKAK